MNLVAARERRSGALLVLMNASAEIARHAGVERAVLADWMPATSAGMTDGLRSRTEQPVVGSGVSSDLTRAMAILALRWVGATLDPTYALTRAREVVGQVIPLDTGRCHVRLVADLKNTQQERMKDCNAKAGDKKGDERKAFMSACLSGKDVAPAKMTQQEKMKACNVKAADKKGDERKAFMSDCLKAAPPA